MTTQHARGAEAPVPGDHHYPDDEIDLTDLALTVWRRRRIVLAVIFLVLLGGAAFAFLMSRTYEYKAIVEIGTQTVGKDAQQIVPIEDVNTALSKLQDAYIPAAIAAALRENSDLTRLQINASVPKGAAVITLSAKAPKTLEPVYISTMKAAVEGLVADHARVIDSKKMDIRLQIERKRAEIDDLDRQVALLQSDIKLTDARLAQTQSSIQRLQTQLANESETVKQAIRAVANEPSAMTMLLLDSQRRAALQWLNNLQDTATDLQRRRDQNQANIAAMAQSKLIKTSEISLLEAQQKALRETRLVYGPAPSIQPAGPSRSLILALALVIGAFAGLMAAFITEFVANVRARLEEVTGTDAPAPMES